MCGIAGIIDINKKFENIEDLASMMCSKLSHRGPDDSGLWIDKNRGVALCHRRLAIIDLTENGHQPMESPCGRYVICSNGEIYNYRTLRHELDDSDAPPKWQGHSDTEVMLAVISRYGLDTALEKFNGMYAFALWDRHEEALYLVRDRMGEKPLYYGWIGNMFVYSSELKALRAHPAWRGEIDRQALSLYLSYSYVPAPRSIYMGVSKLAPGMVLKLSLNEARSSRRYKKWHYWSVVDEMKSGLEDRYIGDEVSALEELELLCSDAVNIRLNSDVPLGAFLSGGIDSSLVVALMQRQSAKAIKTFTVGFTEEERDESTFARATAQYLGSDHEELIVTPADAMHVIPQLPYLYDEPFADSTQIPTYLVAKLARNSVKVVLSGDGGDEVFGGYNRYIWGQDIWNAGKRIPAFARRWMTGALNKCSSRKWQPIYTAIGRLYGDKIGNDNVGYKLQKVAKILSAESIDDVYKSLVVHHDAGDEMVLGSAVDKSHLEMQLFPSSVSVIERMNCLDMLYYLPDNNLVKVDRATMSVGLEARVPYLDHRLIRFAIRLPTSMKLRERQGKWLLRQLLFKYVPRALIERPKRGFDVPMDIWLCGHLREWAEDMINEDRLCREGYFNSNLIRQKWNEHLSGKGYWHEMLWSVLMFQSWYDAQRS